MSVDIDGAILKTSVVPFEDNSVGHTEDHIYTSINGLATEETDIYKYGGGSALFTKGTLFPYVKFPPSVDFDFGDEDFGINCWVYKPEGEDFDFCCEHGLMGSSYPMWGLAVSESVITLWSVKANPSATVINLHVHVSITETGWHHIFAGRVKNDSGYIFIDGIKQTLITNTYNGTVPAISNVSGAVFTFGYGFMFGGSNTYVDAFKIHKGACPYTADFTPPTDEDENNDGDCVLSLNMNPPYINYTVQANEDTANDVVLLPKTIRVGDAFFFGVNSIAYSSILYTMNIGTAGTGTWTLTYYYYNGSDWVALPAENIESMDNQFLNFRTAGSGDMSIIPPVDWATVAVNGVTMYWIEARVTSL